MRSNPRRRTAIVAMLVVVGGLVATWMLTSGRRTGSMSTRWISFAEKGLRPQLPLPGKPISRPGTFSLELLDDERYLWRTPMVHVRLHCHADETRAITVIVDGRELQRLPAAPVVDIRFPGTLTGKQRCVVRVGPPEDELMVSFTFVGPFHLDPDRIGRRVRDWFR